MKHQKSTFFSLAASVLLTCVCPAQRIPDLPAITGAAVDPAADLLWLNDTSAGTAGSKKITLAELVNVSSFTNGNFLAANSLEFAQVNGLQTALDAKQATITDGSLTPAKVAGTAAVINGSNITDPPTFRDAIKAGAVEGPILPLTLSRINTTAATTYDPYRITGFATGDSYAVDLSAALDAGVAPGKGRGMGTSVSYTGAGVFNTTDFGYSPSGISFPLTASGHQVTYPTAAANFYKVHVFYSTISGTAGTFTIEAKTDGGAWTEIPGATTASPIDTNTGSGIGAGVFTYAFSTTQARQFRAVWKTGAVRILGIMATDVWTGAVTKGGSEWFDLAFSGQSVASAVTCPQAVFNTILGTLKPDFATFKSDDDSAAMTSSLQAFITKCNTAWPMDWILVSSHPASSNGASSANELSDADKVVRSVALANGYTFINNRKLFPAFASMQTLGLINGDNYHLSPKGNNLLNAYIADAMSSVLRPQRQHLKWANSTQGTEYAPAKFANPLVTVGDYQVDTEVFKVEQSFGVGGTPSRAFSVQRNLDNSVQFNVTSLGIGHFGWDQYGELQITGGDQGWGYSGPPGKAQRIAYATTEIFSHTWTDRPTLILSATTSHASDLIRFNRDATQASAGTRAAGVKTNGLADFPGLALPPTTVANLPAAPVTNMFATVNDASAFTAGTTVTGGGSVKCLVQYDGAAWKMVLQLY